MISNSALYQIRNAINRIPELRGCRIGFHGNLGSSVLDHGIPPSLNYEIIIIIEEVEEDLGVKLSKSTNAVKLPEPSKILNKTVVGAELTGAFISCGLTLVSGVGIASSIAAEVPTGGASTVILVASWTGFVTQGIQCVNGITRTVEAYRHPDENSLEQWDSNAWYSNTILVVDAAGIISGLVGIGAASASLRKMLTLRGSLPTEEVLKRMSNAERVAAYKEAIRRVSKNPKAAIEFENLVDQLKPGIANRLRQGNEVIIRRNAAGLGKLVSEKTAKAILDATKEIVVNSAGTVFSGMPQQVVGSASGSVNWTGQQLSGIKVNGERIGNIVVNIISGR